MKESAHFRHYIFGEFVATEAPPDASMLEPILRRARDLREKCAGCPIDSIITVLDRVSRLWARKDYRLRRSALEIMPSVVGFHQSMVEHALDALSMLMSRDNLEKKIAAEIPCRGALDHWTYQGISDIYLRAMPRGVVLHVSAGNVFIGGIDSLVHGFLSHNVNILKCSGVDPFFPLLFAESIREADDEGVLSEAFSVLSFSGHDRELEAVLKRSCDAIAVWGGEEAIEAWRRDCPLSTKLIEYGPRMGFSLITRKGMEGVSIEELASSMALDVVMWEQRACSSPQTLFIERGPSCGSFIRELEKALHQKALLLPQGELTLDEEIEILKARERGIMARALGEGNIFFPPGSTAYTLIYQERAAFSVSPLSRCLTVAAFDDADEVFRALEPLRAFLQTASLCADPREMEYLGPALLAAGVRRITNVGKCSEGAVGAPHEGSWQLQELLDWASLEPPAMSGAPEASSSQASLDAMVSWARSASPYYRKRLRNCADFMSFPFLEKEDLYAHTPPRGKDLLARSLEGAYVFASGGSTGAPKFCCYGYDEFDHVGDILARIYQIAGLVRGDMVANLFVAGSLWTSFLAATKALEKIGCTNLPIAGNADIEQILSYMTLFGPNVMLGIPSIIIQIAELVEQRCPGGLKVEKILYGGEHMSPEVRQYLKDVLGAESIMSAGYASVDAGPVGYQCACCEGSTHHVLSEYVHLEIVDGGHESGTGEIVVTNLNRKLMPVIRYRTGDAGRFTGESCPCGRPDPLFELLGRCDDVLRIGAMSIYPGEIEPHLARYEALSHIFQIEASRKGRKEHVRLLVEAKGDCTGDMGHLAHALRRAVIEHNSELALVLREGWLGSFRVEIVPPGTVERVARTGKVRKIADLRKF